MRKKGLILIKFFHKNPKSQIKGSSQPSTNDVLMGRKCHATVRGTP
jgi:hypothetical protein